MSNVKEFMDAMSKAGISGEDALGAWRLAREAEEKRLAREAEEKRLAREAEMEEKRLAREAEEKRLARAAEMEEKRLAREAVLDIAKAPNMTAQERSQALLALSIDPGTQALLALRTAPLLVCFLMSRMLFLVWLSSCAGGTALAHDFEVKLALSAAQKGALEAEKGALKAEKVALEAEKEHFRLAAKQAMSSTERALARPDDVLSAAFEQAPVVDFWLPDAGEGVEWDGPWSEFEQCKPDRKETKTIQPAIETAFTFPPSSPYAILHTHKGWNKMTPDAMLFVRDAPQVEVSVAALFEWVGQDEAGFPSKRHKAKFMRDCIRLWKRCGGKREVHGAISDLSRIVAVRFQGLDDAGSPVAVKTTVMSGPEVRAVLTAFAAAPLEALSVKLKSWQFQQDEKQAGSVRTRSASHLVHGQSVLGSGLHGTVFSVAADPTRFVKEQKRRADCESEVTALRALRLAGVPSVPKLCSVSKDGMAFQASPVGHPVRELQGQVCVFDVGAQLVRCLKSAHVEAKLCHRDVRPSNVVYSQTSGLGLAVRPTGPLFDVPFLCAFIFVLVLFVCRSRWSTGLALALWIKDQTCLSGRPISPPQRSCSS
jgi:hypothetical protein